MKTFCTSIAAAMVALTLPSLSCAQQITQERLASGLGKLSAASPIVDVELLRQEVLNSGGKDVSALPNWSKLAKLQQMIVEVVFENDSVAIKPESYRTLGLLADALHHPNLWAYRYLVVGHTSSTGSDAHNLKLSEDRANAIKEVLSTTFAVDPQRLHAVGVGEYYPIDASKSADADNRRVQLFNLGVFKRNP
jgi:outer membrane protein OmpA-like peptidoglycan-associated protein